MPGKLRVGKMVGLTAINLPSPSRRGYAIERTLYRPDGSRPVVEISLRELRRALTNAEHSVRRFLV